MIVERIPVSFGNYGEPHHGVAELAAVLELLTVHSRQHLGRFAVVFAELPVCFRDRFDGAGDKALVFDELFPLFGKLVPVIRELVPLFLKLTLVFVVHGNRQFHGLGQAFMLFAQLFHKINRPSFSRRSSIFIVVFPGRPRSTSILPHLDCHAAPQPRATRAIGSERLADHLRCRSAEPLFVIVERILMSFGNDGEPHHGVAEFAAVLDLLTAHSRQHLG